MFEELSGKVAIITGASRGIGEASARDLAAHGVAVMLLARSINDCKKIADEIIASGGKAAACACDVLDYDQVEAAVSACIETFGTCDIIVNNAGVIEPIARFEESDPAAWTQAASINYFGVYNGIRAVIPHFLEQKSGVIINISSGAATGALEGWSHYCSSKAAALSLTKCADKEYRDQGIRVIGLSPGTVATNMQVEIKDSGINPVSRLNWEDHIPADWAAKAISWLCTEAASDYCGQDMSLRDDENKRRIGLIT